MKIKQITTKQFNGNVYNIGVEKHHNYFANGILVHNCYQNSNETDTHTENIVQKFAVS